MTEEEQKLINSIFSVRVTNNNPWKRLMEIAMTHDPIAAKKALREINANDKIISDMVGRLAKK